MAATTLAKGITSGLRAAMEKDPKVVLMGEDIGKLGGVFRVTEGLQKDFGEDRVIDTPLAEAGIVGTVPLRREERSLDVETDRHGAIGRGTRRERVEGRLDGPPRTRDDGRKEARDAMARKGRSGPTDRGGVAREVVLVDPVDLQLDEPGEGDEASGVDHLVGVDFGSTQ